MLRVKWFVMRFAVNDFVLCLQWVSSTESCVAGGSLAICVRLGLISPQGAQMGSVARPRQHPGAACGVLEASSEQTVLSSSLTVPETQLVWQ